jgi:hypothetical protein
MPFLTSFDFGAFDGVALQKLVKPGLLAPSATVIIVSQLA